MPSFLDNIFRAKTHWRHLLIRVLLLLIFVGLIIWVALPLIYFALFGSGSGGDRYYSTRISYVIEAIVPLLFGLATSISYSFWHMQNARFSKSKSYAIAAVILLLIYPIRMVIIDAVIRLFQR